MLTIKHIKTTISLAIFLVMAQIYPINNNFILIISLYNEQQSERVKEYVECLERNLTHPLISKIHVIYDTSKEPLEESTFLRFLKTKKIALSKISGRPTFEHCFTLANKLYPNNAIIVSNADIYFNETLELLKPYDLTNRFLALTRWDVQADGTIKPFVRPDGLPNSGSQDTWIFKTPLRKFNNANDQLGTYFCDTRIAYEAKKAGMVTTNPCLSIQCCHLHLSNIRNYEKKPPSNYTSQTKGCFL